MSHILALLSTPTGAAVFAICAIAVIVAAVIGGAAAGARADLAARIAEGRARRATAMRTANSSVINRQVRDLQRRAADTRP